MINELKINIWDIADSKSIVCILTNNTITKENKNIMGAGIAKEVLIRNPGIDYVCAEAIKNNNVNLGIDKISNCLLYRFPTKDKIYYNSNLDIIEDSLKNLIKTADLHPTYKIFLPRPGCGCGGLDWETQVKPLCEKYLNGYKNIYILSK